MFLVYNIKRKHVNACTELQRTAIALCQQCMFCSQCVSCAATQPGRFKLNYFDGWMDSPDATEWPASKTLVKLRLSLRDLDFAHRFGVEKKTL